MQRATRWRTSLLATPVICAAVSGIAGCVSTVAGVPHSGGDSGLLSFGPDLAGPQLAGVLLDVAQVNQIMGTSTMTVFKSYDQMPGDDGTYSDPTCVGAVFNTVEAAYKGSGYVAIRGAQLSDTGSKHYVDQGVVSFGSGPDARKFLATSKDVWRRCVAKHVTYNAKNDSPNTWTIRAPVTTGGITAAIVDEEAGDGYACVHGITAKSNVVIDVSACSYGIADQGVSPASAIINAIAGKFPT
jgi:PknH-like extracellular domain